MTMHITDHAIQRARERFGIPERKLQGVIDRASEFFAVIDRKKSYDESVDIGPKTVLHCRHPNAYFVVDITNRVVTVLTEPQAMHNFKVGKWTKL